jgi:hypothetical protein
MLTSWRIWSERNDRVFDNDRKPIQKLIDQIKADARLWTVARRGRFNLPAG